MIQQATVICSKCKQRYGIEFDLPNEYLLYSCESECPLCGKNNDRFVYGFFYN